MGRSMCQHLLSGGYHVTVSNRTKEKAASLIDAGATWADSPGDVVKNSEIIFTMVGYPFELRELVLGPGGLVTSSPPGTILIDMSTSEPSLAAEIGAVAQERGVYVLDAPVSGGDIGAQNATLTIMVGGPQESFDAVLPCFQLLGKTIILQGGHGAGQHTKMVNQILIANNMVGVCEALLYAYRAGLDLENVLASVSGGGAGSWSLSNLAPRMINGDMAPGFYVDHFVKDMGIALGEARRQELSLPGLALAQQLYISLQAQGGGRDGTQALVRALGSLSGIAWDKR